MLKNSDLAEIMHVAPATAFNRRRVFNVQTPIEPSWAVAIVMAHDLIDRAVISPSFAREIARRVVGSRAEQIDPRHARAAPALVAQWDASRERVEVLPRLADAGSGVIVPLGGPLQRAMDAVRGKLAVEDVADV